MWTCTEMDVCMYAALTLTPYSNPTFLHWSAWWIQNTHTPLSFVFLFEMHTWGMLCMLRVMWGLGVMVTLLLLLLLTMVT